MAGEGLCRACLSVPANDALLCMFDSALFSCEPLHELYTRCTGLPVHRGDGLSLKLCQICAQNLRNAHNFVQQCERSEEQFRRTYVNVKQPIKVEPEESEKFSLSTANSNEASLDEKTNLFPSTLTDVQLNVTENLINSIKHEKDYISDSDDSIDAEPLSTYLKYNKSFKTENNKTENSIENSIFLKKKHKNSKIIAKHYCQICQKKFLKLSALKRHMANHDADSKPFECTECYRRFKREDLLIRHSTIHLEGMGFDASKPADESTKYKCESCNLEFTTKNGHSSHMKKHKSEFSDLNKKHSCPECGKSFSKSSHLNRHIKIHSKEKPYHCNLCEKQYCRQDQLLTHVNKHNGVKPNVCTICGKAFAQICNLKDHLRIHTGETPFLCSICGKGFNNGSNLRQHVLRHTGLTPFACTLCPKKFVSKGELTNHIISHSGAHPYVCDICGHSFTKPTSLKKHKRIHLGIKPFECDVCSMKFTYKDILKRHYRIHTGEKPYPCKYCNRSFVQSNDLVKHTRLHVGENIYECKICHEKFRLQSDLKIHYPIHYVKTDGDDAEENIMKKEKT